jgi:uncharacterized delta-60 repeat protein
MKKIFFSFFFVACTTFVVMSQELPIDRHKTFPEDFLNKQELPNRHPHSKFNKPSYQTEASNINRSLKLQSAVANGKEPEWVRHYASGLAPASDQANDIAIDNQGNIYVTGYSDGSGTDEDYVTVKYNSQGEEQWVARYNGPGNYDDEAYALAVDNFGNVYVTGYSYGSGTYSDYATVKYNSQGEEQWVARYNGPTNSYDYAYALAVDNFGNVYVTGYSRGSETDRDYATIKYNSQGEEQWVARYNGPGNYDDEACALAVDNSGNVYVTGYSVGSGTSTDYATIKYNSQGKEQWVARYNGTGNYDDVAYALAVDNFGNVYVTGYSRGSETDRDYATVKYNSQGKEQWVARYNGTGNYDDVAYALAVDNFGNVYVTGYSRGSETDRDYATVKYNSQGKEQWVARYNGPRNSWDEACALAVDNSGNVYVTGRSYGSETYDDYATIKYNSQGEEQWVARYNEPGNSYDDEACALAVDNFGNVYVTGYSVGSGTYSDYATVKYNSQGKEQWVARYNGPRNSRDVAYALAVDNSGNVYVTGYSFGSGTYSDYATVKYNSQGEEQWVARYNGPGNSYDYAEALAVDNSGNVYVTGYSVGSGTGYDYATVKYNSQGEEQWVARYNGPGNFSDCACALAVDNSGNVYVTGYSDGSGINYDYATIKYNSKGEEQWVARYNGPGDSSDYAFALAVDNSGNVYVTGYSYGSGTYDDYATIKYNSQGEEQWVARYNGTGNSYDEACALAVDNSGNVYVTGRSYGSETYDDYATVKYNSQGEEQWVARYNGTENSIDRAYALAVDNSGNVYVTGSSYGSETYDDYATVKYNSQGEEQWVARYNGSGNSDDRAQVLAIDNSGNVYVTGRSYGSGTYDDYATIKYNSQGEEQWVARYNGPGNYYYNDVAYALAVDNSGNVYVTGRSTSSKSSVYTTIKYSSGGADIVESTSNTPVSYFLSQNYPNPFNPTTTIEYQLPKASKVTMKVYDILGREVATLVDDEVKSGYHTATFDGLKHASGIYFVRMTAQGSDAKPYIKTMKIVLMK